MHITLRRTQIEVGCRRRSTRQDYARFGGRWRPSYRWTTGYYVTRPDGTEEHPPVRRADAYKRARELGATKITVKD